MAILSTGAYKLVVKHLGPHGPDGVLAFVLFIGALTAVAQGMDPWFVAFLTMGIGYGYAVRQTKAEKHRERLEELAVEKKETDLRVYRERQAAKLSKEKRKEIPNRDGKQAKDGQ